MKIQFPSEKPLGKIKKINRAIQRMVRNESGSRKLLQNLPL